MKISEAIATRLNDICSQRDLTVNKLASLGCMTQSTLEYVISGKSKNPKMLTIVRICDGLGISLKEFYDDEVFNNLDRED